MLRRDYIQRMIDEFAKVLGHAMQLNAKGERDEALRTLRDSYSTFFSNDVQLINHLLPTQIIKKLKDDGLTSAQIEIFAEALRQEADLLMDSDQRAAKDRYVKSLALFEYVEAAEPDNFSIPRRNSIEEIKYCISAL